MPKFYVQFTKDGESQNRTVEANDEGGARIRFLNHSDIAFQAVDIVSIQAVATDTTKAAKPERLTKRKVGRSPDKGWRERCLEITAEIENLAVQKQAAARKSDWQKTDALQESMRKLVIERTQLAKKNGPGAARA